MYSSRKGIAKALLGFTICFLFLQDANAQRETATARSKQELQRIDSMLADNAAAADKLFNKILLHITAQANGVKRSLAGEESTDKLDSFRALIEALSPDALERASGGYEIGKSLNDRNRALAMAQITELLMSTFGDLLPASPYSLMLKGGIEAVDLAAIAYEAWTLTRERAELLKVHGEVEKALNKLRAPEWQDILRRLRGNPAAEQAAFERWLTQLGIRKSDVLEKAIRDSNESDPRAGMEVARGAVIVDPQQAIGDLRNVSGINPDFIAALERCSKYPPYLGMSREYFAAAMACNKYSDGSYIPAFGPSQGIGNRPLYTSEPIPRYPDQPSGRTLVASGQGNLVAPGSDRHGYTVFRIDTARFANGGTLEIEITVGDGASTASFDVFPEGARLPTEGFPTDQGSLANAYNLDPGQKATITYTLDRGQRLLLCAEGSWLSDQGSTNSFAYRAWVIPASRR